MASSREENAERVRAAFLRQAAACRELGSPFTAWLCDTLPDLLDPTTPLGARVLGWTGDPTSAGDAVPLRLCGGLHALALSRRDPALADLYAEPEPSAAARDAVQAALSVHQAALMETLDRPPQTNEVARAAFVWLALRLIAERTSLPLALMEVGASAGLTLNLDRFAYSLGGVAGGDRSSALHLEPAWSGAAPAGVEPVIAARAGCDLSPLDPSDPEARLRLMSYIWSDQPARRARMVAALDIAAAHPVVVDRADAVDWLSVRLSDSLPGVARVVFSTIAWQYLPSRRRAEGEAVIKAAGAQANEAAPLAWVSFEADGETPGALLSLDFWPGERRIRLARGDFHGRWIRWTGCNASATLPHRY